MRGLAGLDGLLDQGQHLRRKDAPHPPAVLHQMFADAFDAHNQLQTYQLPDAPPPPKLPPPPEKPPLLLDLLPPENEPPPPDQLPPRPPDGATLDAKRLKMAAPIARIIDSASDPTKSHTSTPTTPPVASAPISLPSKVRSTPPATKTPNRMRGLNSISIRPGGS